MNPAPRGYPADGGEGGTMTEGTRVSPVVNAVDITTDYGFVIRFAFMRGGEIDIDYRETTEEGWTTFGSVWPEELRVMAKEIAALTPERKSLGRRERRMSNEQREFPNVAEMTFAELLEAVALNSDMATHYNERCQHIACSDAEDERLTRKATRHYDRRNACMRELQRRHDAVLATHSALTAAQREALRDVLAWIDGAEPHSADNIADAVSSLRALAAGQPS